MIKNIILGAGCFWCTEAAFSIIEGVTKVVPGYSGGYKKNPTYEEVCEGNTGHAEVVYLEYDDQRIGLEEILEIFMTIHDPTSLNRQGNDIGEQYRSAIYYTDDNDLPVIRKFLMDWSKHLSKPIVTEVKKAGEFYKAEDYHISYFINNPDNPYCRYVIAPKINKIRQKFTELVLE